MSGSLTNPNAVVTANDLSDFYQRIYPYLGGSGGSGGSGVPDGGTTGQILAKKSNVNGDVEWINNEVGSEIASELESLSTLMSELTSSVSSESTAQSQIDSTQNRSLSSLGAASSELGSEVAVLNSEVADKQDILTAGPGITISGNIISSTSGISFAVVDALPTTNISTSTIYLLPKLDTDTDDIYDEWGYINNTWEHLGNTKIDLSNYYNKTQIDSKFTSQSTIDSTQTRQISSLSQSASELASVVTSQSIAQSQLDSTQNIALGSLSTENSTQASEIESLSTETSEIISAFESQSTAQSEFDSTQNRSLNSLSAENSYHTSEIGSLSTTSSVLSSTVAVLGREVAAKQDKLTAGTGVSIQNNVISVTGEGQGGGDVSSEVESLSTLMSELANIVSSEAVAQSEIDSTQNSYINSLTSENIVRRFEVSSLFTDTSELGSEVDIINSEVAVINSELAEKQNILTAGPGITISGTTISSTPRLEYAVVDALPVTDISTTTLYLLPKLDTDTDDIYDEWAYINNAWEHIGNTKIDLTDYYNKTQIDSVFASQSTEDSLQARQISSLSVSASELASFVSSESVAQSQLDSTQNRTLSSLSVASSELGSEVIVLNSEVAEKQDTLTAGSGINIDGNNVIKAVARMLFPSGS